MGVNEFFVVCPSVPRPRREIGKDHSINYTATPRSQMRIRIPTDLPMRVVSEFQTVTFRLYVKNNKIQNYATPLISGEIFDQFLF